MLKIALFAVALVAAGSASAQVSVRGYTRSDGTYVAPHIRTSPNSTTADNYSSRPAPPYSPTYVPPAPTYAPAPAAPACSGYGCYGQPSATTGQPRTETVNGYIRSDGTYVAPYVRSRPR
jgi:hypothetical protein